MKHSSIYLVVFLLCSFAVTGCNSGSSNEKPSNIVGNWTTSVPYFKSGGYSKTDMDNQGNIIIVTWHFNDSNSHYEIIRHEFRNNAWGEPEVISNVPGQPYNAAYDPVISMDNKGNAIIIWHQTGDAALMITEYRNGSWSSPRVLSYLVKTSQGHSIAMNDLGRAAIVWATNRTIYKVELVDGVWSTPITLGVTNSSYDPKVKINESGNGVIIWLEGDDRSILSSELDQDVWNAPKIIGIANRVTSPDLEIDSNGNAIVVWEKRVDTGNTQIFKNELKNLVWSEPKSVSEDGIQTFDHSLAMSINGNAVITWQQLYNIEYQIYLNNYMDGSWDTPTPVSPLGINSVNPLVKMDESGNSILVWNEIRGTSWQVMMSQMFNGSWSDGEYFSISDNKLNPVTYDIDMNSNGDAIFVWGQSDSGAWFEYRSQYIKVI